MFLFTVGRKDTDFSFAAGAGAGSTGKGAVSGCCRCEVSCGVAGGRFNSGRGSTVVVNVIVVAGGPAIIGGVIKL